MRSFLLLSGLGCLLSCLVTGDPDIRLTMFWVGFISMNLSLMFR